MPAPTLLFHIFSQMFCYTGLCIRELVKAHDHAQTLVLRFLGVRLAPEVKKDQDRAALRACIPNTWALGQTGQTAVSETPLLLSGDHDGGRELCPCGIQSNQPVCWGQVPRGGCQAYHSRNSGARTKERPCDGRSQTCLGSGASLLGPRAAAAQAGRFHSCLRCLTGKRG